MDEARKWTDKELKKMESEIADIYRQATDELTKKWNNYMDSSAKRIDKYQKDYDAAVKGGDEKEIKETAKKLEDAKKNQTLRSAYYKNMVDETTTQLANVNQTAVAYMNGQVPSVYMKNYNFIDAETKQLQLKTGLKFNLVDENVVKRRIMDGDIKLPKKKVDIPKDKRWNTKQLNSSVLQGILQGESMQNISKRILPVVNNNKQAAIRNARTMVTGAENQGRNDRFKRLEEGGAVIKKVWMATGDGRTRDWHIDMDGQEVDVKESFIDGLGNELEYPGDPGGAPETVYNCRCTMVSDIIGFRRDDGSISYIKYNKEDDGESLHDKEIREEREARGRTDKKVEKQEKAENPKHTVVQGQDISDTWTRRPDEFKFEIEDVINAQGFDGLPQVVSPEEFERYVQEANGGNGFIAQRTYSAPDQETLDAYRDMLYNGKWYVDCGTGGAQYGQGMYCAADYTGKLSSGIRNEMKHYQMLGSERIGDISQENLDLIVKDQKMRANEVLSQYKSGKISKEAGLAEYRKINAMNPSEYVATYMRDSNIDGARSYVETMTLDSSAKVINYSDLEREFNSWKLDAGSRAQREIIESYRDKGEDFVKMLQYNSVDGGVKFMDAQEAYSRLSDSDKKLVHEVTVKMNDAWRDADVKVAKENIGTYAASKGYDAINAEGHGESSSYTVVLNRTKLIIKGE